MWQFSDFSGIFLLRQTAEKLNGINRKISGVKRFLLTLLFPKESLNNLTIVAHLDH
jgi:hypothetical protein